MAAHTMPQREFIVQRLAAFYAPKDIAAAFAIRWPDTACNENDVLANDPSLTIVPPEIFALFRSEREKVLLDPTAAPFAEQTARLILLSRLVERYAANNQLAEARAVLRQIAEETGVVGGSGKAGKAADESKTPEVKTITVKRSIVDPAARVEE